ncbi:hypothetical protein [Caenimonas sp. SL110]|uniref:hypothetical protein n=1 Tax=Caenimonas sp. SL110 TaxID=1450524 RepID=UPI0006531794|nr:hypothetical protein [Caenimonas sp. SL110]
MIPAPNLNFAAALAPVVIHVDRTTPPPPTRGFKLLNSTVQWLQNASRSAVSWGGRPAVYFGTYEFVMSAGRELQLHAGIDPSEPAAMLSLQEIAHALAAFSQAQYVGTTAALVDAAWNAPKIALNAVTRMAFDVNAFGGAPKNASYLADQARFVPPGFGLCSAGKVAAGQFFAPETPSWEGIYGADPSANALLTLEYAGAVQGAPFVAALFRPENLNIPAVPGNGPIAVLEQMWTCKHAAAVTETSRMAKFFPMGLVQGNMNFTLQHLADDGSDIARMVFRVGIAAAGTAGVHTTRVGMYMDEKKKADQLRADGVPPAGVVMGPNDSYLHPEGQVLRSFQVFCYALCLLGSLTAIGMVQVDPSEAESQVGDELAMKLAIAFMIAAAGEASRFVVVKVLDGLELAPEGGKAAEEIGDMSVAAAAIGATFAAGPLAGLAAAAMKPLAQLIHAGYDRMMTCRTAAPAGPAPGPGGPAAVPMVVVPPVVAGAGAEGENSIIPGPPPDSDPEYSSMGPAPSREPSTERKHDSPRNSALGPEHPGISIDASEEPADESHASPRAPSRSPSRSPTLRSMFREVLSRISPSNSMSYTLFDRDRNADSDSGDENDNNVDRGLPAPRRGNTPFRRLAQESGSPLAMSVATAWHPLEAPVVPPETLESLPSPDSGSRLLADVPLMSPVVKKTLTT